MTGGAGVGMSVGVGVFRGRQLTVEFSPCMLPSAPHPTPLKSRFGSGYQVTIRVVGDDEDGAPLATAERRSEQTEIQAADDAEEPVPHGGAAERHAAAVRALFHQHLGIKPSECLMLCRLPVIQACHIPCSLQILQSTALTPTARHLAAVQATRAPCTRPPHPT